MTVKDGELYVGSHGTEVPKGDAIDHSLQVRTDGKNRVMVVTIPIKWVKIISPAGNISHVNWTERYHALGKALGVHPGGYGAASQTHICGHDDGNILF